jgi:polyribonucleotide nucleotidyltransferase
MKIITKSIKIGGRILSLEVGRFAQQATAAVLVRYGDTMVLATVTASSKETMLDYFPLSVEYVERLYAGGRIKGSRWVKREGRPSDDAVLAGRVIDRSIRPLFPKTYKHDVQVVITTLSMDGENDPDVLGLIGASAAIAISPIPWNGPVSMVRMGYVKEEGKEGLFVVNPTHTQQELSDFDFLVASRQDEVMMLEGGFCETPEDIVYEAVRVAKKENAKILGAIGELVKEVGKKKTEVVENVALDELKETILKKYKKEMEDVFIAHAAKETGSEEVVALANQIVKDSEEKEKWNSKQVMDMLDKLFKKKVREDVLTNEKRVDGRKIDEIRPIEIELGILPRTHGSAMFTRGQTQALTIATLGTPSLEQLIESPTGEESKRYIHHYSMPPYSVGETGRMGVPSRREIGHGALAERALLSVIPSEEEFPYTIRLVSEIMSSNGSTSMASACGSTLALMDAGVPIKEPVAGISIGLMTEEKKSTYVLLTDIMGIEDFAGDMDFKVAGTKNGITAIQLDMKITGITDAIIKDTLSLAKNARIIILKKILAAIPAPRAKLSQYAPKVKIVKIPVERIGEVIGPGGKIIRNIIATTGATVDVNDDGSVFISAPDEAAVEKAVTWVEGLTHEVKIGEEFEGEVKRILPFGAFVEILPGKEGMVHVSQMSTGFVSRPEDVVAIGQKVKVRVLEIDDMRRVNLSMLFGDDAKNSPSRQRRENDDRGDRGPRRFGRSRRF